MGFANALDERNVALIKCSAFYRYILQTDEDIKDFWLKHGAIYGYIERGQPLDSRFSLIS